MVPEGSYSSSGRVGEELEIVQDSSSDSESLENRGPAALVLVAVRELDVRVRESVGGFFEFFETDDSRGGGAVGVPGVVADELAADAGEGERKKEGKERSARERWEGRSPSSSLLLLER